MNIGGVGGGVGGALNHLFYLNFLFYSVKVCIMEPVTEDGKLKEPKRYKPCSKKVYHLLDTKEAIKVHLLSSGKGEMFLCSACHAFTPHVNAWKI